MGDTDSFYSESNESLIDEIFGTLSRNRSLRRDEVKGKRSNGVIKVKQVVNDQKKLFEVISRPKS